MTETITIKKKKKKQFDYKKAVEILKPLVRKWSELDEEVARKLHTYYLQPECRLNKLCESLGINEKTAYRLFDKYELPRKYEALSEAMQEMAEEKASQDVQLSPAEYEDEITTEFDTAKYQETWGLLDRVAHLTPNKFKVVEKKELIEKLQDTIKKLNGLLLKLESNLEE